MGRWLALARADADEKNAKSPVCDTPKTPKTLSAEVLGVLGVSDPGNSEKNSAPAEAGSGGFGGFGGKPNDPFSKNSPASLPAPEPATRPQVVSPEPPEAAVARFDSEIEMTVPAGADHWETARALIEMAGEIARPGRRYLFTLIDDENSEKETRH